MPLSRIKNQSVETVMKTGRRNLLINGNFKIWQRDNDRDHTGSGWDYLSCDRFLHNKGRYQQVDETVEGKSVKAMKISPSSGVYNGGRGVLQRIEEYDIYEHDLIFSAYVKSDAAHTVSFGNVYTGSVTSNSKTISLTTDWKRYSIKIPASSHTLTQVPDQYLITNFTDGRTYYIANAQLEFDYGNGIPSPFEYRSTQEELRLCHRYFYRWASAVPASSGTLREWVYNIDDNDSYRRGPHRFPMPMRSTPTCTITWNGTPGSGRGLQHISNTMCNPWVDGVSTYAYYTDFTAEAEL